MSRAKPTKKARRSAAVALPENVLRVLQVATIRLARANDVLNCLDVCARYDAELDLGALALAARDLVDKVLNDLAPFGRQGGAP